MEVSAGFFSFWGPGGESANELIPYVGEVQFLVVVGLWSCSLSGCQPGAPLSSLRFPMLLVTLLFTSSQPALPH